MTWLGEGRSGFVVPIRLDVVVPTVLVDRRMMLMG